MTRVITATIFLSFLFISSSHAQILNVEKSKLANRDTTNFFVSTVSVSLRQFNRSAGVDNPVNLFGFNASGDLGYFDQKNAYIFINKYDYLRINNNVFLSNGYSHLRTSFNHRERFHYEVFTQFQYDNFRGLDPRIIAGGSFRFRAIRSTKFDLTIGSGGFYENERWLHPTIEDSVTRVEFIKSSTYANFRWEPNQLLNLNGIVFYQTGYDRSISRLRNRVSAEINVIISITERLSLINRFTADYEDRPIVPITPYLFSFTNGLQFRL
ncbi:MAG: DUF481 domain-containing protein [Cyclobacteriaceae bacterium]|nr:DUF481 domain-containing protein [Cyclobacteriaceae bacterium]MCH8514961.1 DUF481 domain-containing protein [Cyclobacteriaceae bacterium]